MTTPIEFSLSKTQDQERINAAVAILSAARQQLEVLLSTCWHKEAEEAIQEVVDTWPTDVGLLELDLDRVEDL